MSSLWEEHCLQHARSHGANLIWKGTAQDCIDHLRLRNCAGLSVKASTLGKCFPPWTVARMAWSDALRPTVYGIATDVMLFSQHGPDWFTGTVCMEIMCRTMCRLSNFMHWACADARLVAKHGRDSSTESISSPVRPVSMPLGPAHHTPDNAPPTRKAARAATSAASPDDTDTSSAPTPTSTPASTSPLPLGPACRTPVHPYPARKAMRAMTSLTSLDEI